MERDWMNKLDKPQMLPIAKREREAEDVDTFTFRHELGSQPGQYVMLWLPGVNEKPFSVAYDDGKTFALTIAKVGTYTEAIFALDVGDRVGIRGPYGRPFTKVADAKRVAMVGGGYGVAPLASLAEKLTGSGIEVHFINGARSKAKLVFLKRLSKLPGEVITTTDDGSFGEKGRVTGPLAKLLDAGSVDTVYTCGPELMEKAVFDLCEQHGVPLQASVERYMKCGLGVCGACSVDGTGQPVCIKGPVVGSETLRKITEFGKHHRTGSGKKEPL